MRGQYQVEGTVQGRHERLLFQVNPAMPSSLWCRDSRWLDKAEGATLLQAVRGHTDMAQGARGGCRSQASAEHDAIKGKAEGWLCAHHLSDGRMVARLEAIPRSDAYATHGESMNKEQTKKAIEVMQAYVDGKKIVYKPYFEHAPWVILMDPPSWNWHQYDYRVKHEIINYKRALFRIGIATPHLGVITKNEYYGKAMPEYFIRWIDEEWQEVEV
jgi:hypothetical protein